MLQLPGSSKTQVHRHSILKAQQHVPKPLDVAMAGLRGEFPVVKVSITILADRLQAPVQHSGSSSAQLPGPPEGPSGSSNFTMQVPHCSHMPAAEGSNGSAGMNRDGLRPGLCGCDAQGGAAHMFVPNPTSLVQVLQPPSRMPGLPIRFLCAAFALGTVEEQVDLGRS